MRFAFAASVLCVYGCALSAAPIAVRLFEKCQDEELQQLVDVFDKPGEYSFGECPNGSGTFSSDISFDHNVLTSSALVSAFVSAGSSLEPAYYLASGTMTVDIIAVGRRGTGELEFFRMSDYDTSGGTAGGYGDGDYFFTEVIGDLFRLRIGGTASATGLPGAIFGMAQGGVDIRYSFWETITETTAAGEEYTVRLPVTVMVVPEPGTWLLAASAAVAFAIRRRITAP